MGKTALLRQVLFPGPSVCSPACSGRLRSCRPSRSFQTSDTGSSLSCRCPLPPRRHDRLRSSGSAYADSPSSGSGPFHSTSQGSFSVSRNSGFPFCSAKASAVPWRYAPALSGNTSGILRGCRPKRPPFPAWRNLSREHPVSPQYLHAPWLPCFSRQLGFH